MAELVAEIDPPVTLSDIKKFAEDKVNLPADVARERRQKVRDVRDQLAGWIKENPDCGFVKSYLSGSLAKGTALWKSSDIDVAVYISHDGERKVDRELIEWIAGRLRKAYPQMSPDQIEPQEFSVKITFKGLGIDIDIVPVFYEGDPDDKGWLVSKRTGRLMLTSIPMHLEFIRKRKAAQKKHFAQAVRLIKWWAAEQKAANAGFRFKSFMVELICAHLADEGQDFSDYRRGLEAFFGFIVKAGLETRISFTDYYPASELPVRMTDPIEIFDPVNPRNNAASQYTVANRRLIVEAAQDALDALNEAHTAATKGHAVEMWQVVLGRSFRG